MKKLCKYDPHPQSTVLMVEVPTPDINLEADVRRILASVDESPEAPQAPESDATITIEVSYEGPDLSSTATFFGISVTELVQAHTSQRWRVAMMGFAPGFGYLEPIDTPLLPWSSLPRRTTPRTTYLPLCRCPDSHHNSQ